MNLNIKYIIGSLLFVFSLISCQQAIQTQKTDLKTLEFEEYNHVNLNLITSETKILTSQDEIDKIYFKINENNPSPRKNPIPAYSENDTYIVIQPKITQSDFMVKEVSGQGEKLEIEIEQFNNSEFKNQKYPVSIIRINKESNYKTIELKK